MRVGGGRELYQSGYICSGITHPSHQKRIRTGVSVTYPPLMITDQNPRLRGVRLPGSEIFRLIYHQVDKRHIFCLFFYFLHYHFYNLDYFYICIEGRWFTVRSRGVVGEWTIFLNFYLWPRQCWSLRKKNKIPDGAQGWYHVHTVRRLLKQPCIWRERKVHTKDTYSIRLAAVS